MNGVWAAGEDDDTWIVGGDGLKRGSAGDAKRKDGKRPDSSGD